MNRRALVAGSLSLLTAPLAAEAQQAGKVYGIGYLGPGSQMGSELRQAFEQALRERR